MSQVDLGKMGENLVLEKYQSLGYALIVKNFQYYREGRAGRLGEIDLIFEKNERMYLVEVKTRTDKQFGAVASQVTKTKMNYIFKTQQYFIKKYPRYQNHFWQFDLAMVLAGKIEIIPNAFSW